MSRQRRNPRAGIEDRWYRQDRDHGKVPSVKHGTGKRWRARWVEADGREREKLFGRKIDAQAHIDSVTAAVVSGDYVPPEGPETPLRVAAERWRVGLNVKRSTRDGYESLLKVHVLKRWGDVPLRGITPSGVRGWLQDLQTGDKAVSDGYARKCGRVLSMILDVAVGDRLLSRHPMAQVKLPRPNAPRQGWALTETQLARLIKAVPTEQDRT